MTDTIAVVAVGIISAICAVVVRKQVPELALLLIICAGAVVMFRCSGVLRTVVEFMRKLTSMGGMESEIAAPVFRVSGIALVTRLGADFCRDADESALAAAVETGGSLFALLAVLPLMSAVLELLSVLL